MTDLPPSPHRTRRNLLRAALFLVLIAALVFLPPYINGERYRHRIATAMSQGLGRPVHIDTVSFHLLPTTGITLGGLVVDENPAFGNEPVIRANVVEATLRLGSLWRRQIEISRLSFGVDANGAGPSVNIVRNPDGRWNLQDILTQAAHVSTAPTSQAAHGPAPRFPYIEATGARINLKLGNEKMPFSLTDADFALWLASPERWQIRLKATPLRTDTNASDTGSITLEGTLGRAATLADMPLALTASWARAPLGEATRVLTGNDQQWRGTLDAGATLTGTMSAAQLTATVHLTELRRADFVPTVLLDVSAHCTASADLSTAMLGETSCTMPDGGPKPITMFSPAISLQAPTTAAINVDVQQMPVGWLLHWARLMTQQIPDMHVDGTVEGALRYAPAANATSARRTSATKTSATGPSATGRGASAGGVGDGTVAAGKLLSGRLPPPPQPGWTGSLEATLHSITRNGESEDFSTKPIVLHAELQTAPASLVLSPVTVRSAGLPPAGAQSAGPQPVGQQSAGPQLTVSGSADAAQVLLHVSGAATPVQLQAFGSGLFTPLGADLASAVQAATPTTAVAADILCIHSYSGTETCRQAQPVVVKSKPRHHR